MTSFSLSGSHKNFYNNISSYDMSWDWGARGNLTYRKPARSFNIRIAYFMSALSFFPFKSKRLFHFLVARRPPSLQLNSSMILRPQLRNVLPPLIRKRKHKNLTKNSLDNVYFIIFLKPDWIYTFQKFLIELKLNYWT
jgi:hypothetical protein